ncbi:MAG TPA: hypothetical protein VJU61_09565, partial [Polyangiaceae bacterium]|nr:hypothetical protein [Polyangiaceae bacterium]
RERQLAVEAAGHRLADLVLARTWILSRERFATEANASVGRIGPCATRAHHKRKREPLMAAKKKSSKKAGKKRVGKKKAGKTSKKKTGKKAAKKKAGKRRGKKKRAAAPATA